jgi:hypothetical protein
MTSLCTWQQSVSGAASPEDREMELTLSIVIVFLASIAGMPIIGSLKFVADL